MPADIRAYLEIRSTAAGNFSPDGTRLLIASDVPGTAQLFRVPSTGGEPRQLTDEAEPVSGRYLPTSNDLLLAMDAGGNERHQLYLADDEGGPRRDLVVDPDHIHRAGGVSRDGRLLAYATNRRSGVDFDIWIRDLRTGGDTMVFAPGGWCSAGAFSPDGRWLSVVRLTERSGDNEVHLYDRDTGESFELLPHDEPAVVGSPSWLPDSSGFVFSHSVGSEFTRAERFDMATRAHEPILDGAWDTGAAIDWSGRHLLVTRNADGYTEAELRDPITLDLNCRLSLPGRGTAGGWTISKDGSRVAFTYSSGLVPGDVWVADTATGQSTRLTHSHCEVDPGTFVEPELVRVPSFDGEQIPAFVFRPRGAAQGKRPVVVILHGGPESQYRPSFAPLTQYLLARGFAVVAPNVRGSTGYGKRYEHLDDVDKRFDAVADLAAIHDWLATTDDLDPDRAALYGGSYGGWLVLMGLTHQPERWAAGVDIVGMSSLVTFLENTADWRRKFREREYGSLAEHRDLLEDLSPINRVADITAPLFVIHGANDPRVPVGEARQIHRVLGERGVRCELLVYPDEGHGLGKLANRIDAYPKVADFLTEILRP